MYKDKYKKKKSDQALNCGGAASAGSSGNVKLEESADNLLSMVKQRTGSFGDRPARPTLLEQVLNQKRLSLLRSPEVVQFLQTQQQLLNQQVLEQRQQQFPGAAVWADLPRTVTYWCFFFFYHIITDKHIFVLKVNVRHAGRT